MSHHDKSLLSNAESVMDTNRVMGKRLKQQEQLIDELYSIAKISHTIMDMLTSPDGSYANISSSSIWTNALEHKHRIEGVLREIGDNKVQKNDNK